MRHSMPLSFEEAVMDVSAGNNKVQKINYLKSGKFPIVDQGQELVGGYSNLANDVVKGDGPWIVFGDHTRVFKFIDFPFCMGADGVKVLIPRSTELLDTKYLYHFLVAHPVESAGYSRHFRFLKRLMIHVPPLDEQRRITAIFDKLDAVRQARKQTIAFLKSLRQSFFLSRFDDLQSLPFVPIAELLREPLTNGISPSKGGDFTANVLTLDAVTSGAFKQERHKLGHFKDSLPESKLVRRGDFMVARGNGNLNLVGRGALIEQEVSNVAYPDTMISVRLDRARVDPLYLSFVWGEDIVRQQIERSAKTTNGTYKINQASLSDIQVPMPSRERQKNMSEFVEKHSQILSCCDAQMVHLDGLVASLQIKCFGAFK